MNRIKMLLDKSWYTLKESGWKVLLKKTYHYIRKALKIEKPEINPQKTFMDVLFINGCFLPHPSRYRVSHQREQLLANAMSSNEVFYEDLTLDLVKNYRLFIFFRCPYTEIIGQFIKSAKQHNKTVLFDIDDLVIDTKYTSSIKYLDTMTPEERKGYDDGVCRMQKTLCLCDGAITTTERLAEELKNYVPEVYVNRNVASDCMVERSQRAVYDRDKRPYEDITSKMDRRTRRRIIKEKEEAEAKKQSGIVRIGYFSGSITHNDDVALILPVIVQIMREFANVEFWIAGELDVPPELEEFKGRIIANPFVDWTKLPQLIASVDINIAPLENGVFNEAKSENKWVEAALVKVPTVASAVGAMSRMIENEKTGFLCGINDEWYAALKKLISDEKCRLETAERAYQYVMKKCVSIYTGFPITKYLKSKMKPNIAFVLPSTQISGGVLVALKHCLMLQKAGCDVLIINEDFEQKDIPFEQNGIFVISNQLTQIHGSFDKVVATLWATLAFLELYPNIKQRYYLVQNFETDFYEPGQFFKFSANQTYNAPMDVKYITISKWCRDWLNSGYEKNAAYAPNGLDTTRFVPKQRDFKREKIRILVEGNSDDYYKNVDESFKIVEKLDKEKYEIWFMSYQGKPKEWYHVDKFLHRVPYEKVPEVYHQCDILIKSSILESFSYPPLEMMATGGFAVVAPNEGNVEYLVDETNCLFYEQGNIDSAVQAIERIVGDAGLREMLYQGGVETAKRRNWDEIEEEILQLYEA